MNYLFKRGRISYKWSLPLVDWCDMCMSWERIGSTIVVHLTHREPNG